MNTNTPVRLNLFPLLGVIVAAAIAVWALLYAVDQLPLLKPFRAIFTNF